MALKGLIKKSGTDLTKPAPTLDYLVGVIIGVMVLLAGFGIAKYGFAWVKDKTAGVTGRVEEAISLPV